MDLGLQGVPLLYLVFVQAHWDVPVGFHLVYPVRGRVWAAQAYQAAVGVQAPDHRAARDRLAQVLVL